MRERIIGELVTADRVWRVQAVDGDRGPWYRLTGPHGHNDELSIATVERLLRDAGVDMADLTPLHDAA